MTIEEEKVLLEESRSRPESFGVLFEHYYPKILGYVFRRVLVWESARDITSEVFLKAYQGLWRYRWTGVSVGAWFYRIATNEVNMYFRRGQYAAVSLQGLTERQGFDPIDESHFEKEKEEAELEAQAHVDFLRVQSQLRELPVKYQEVIALRYFEHKSNKEISEILGKNEGTVKSLLSRGLGKLK